MVVIDMAKDRLVGLISRLRLFAAVVDLVACSQPTSSETPSLPSEITLLSAAMSTPTPVPSSTFMARRPEA